MNSAWTKAVPAVVLALVLGPFAGSALAAKTTAGKTTAKRTASSSRSLYGDYSNDTPAGCPSGTAACPSADPFYVDAPKNLASLKRGTLIGVRAATIGEPGMTAAIQAAYTISYRSSDAFGAPVMDTATVMIPSAPYTGSGSQPLVSFQYAEDSLGAQCQPSYDLAHPDTNNNVDAESADVLNLLARGYVVVAPDFEGPAEQYIVGQQEGHAVLDGLRATLSLPAAHLTRSAPIALDGYSGGAHATDWAAELAHRYAPKLNIVGAAEGGTPANLVTTGNYIDGTVFFGLALMSTEALDRGFPGAGIYSDLNAAGRSAYAAMSTDCVGQGVTAYPFDNYNDYTTVPNLTDTSTLEALLAHEQLGQSAPGFPILNYHVYNDEIVPFTQDETLVKYYCSKGTPVQFVPITGDHISGEAIGSPLVQTFFQDRFDDDAPVDDCAAVEAMPMLPQVPALSANST